MMLRFLLLLTLLEGCVSRGRHELLEVQFDATRTAANARESSCREDIAALEAGAREARHQIELGNQRIADLSGLATDLEGRLAEANAREADALTTDPDEALASVRAAEIVQALQHLALVAQQEERGAARHALAAAAFASLQQDGYATLRRDGEASILTVPASKLFNEGQALLSPLGETVIDRLAAALAGLPHQQMLIRGHTDSQPVHSLQYPSNWELGFAYAMAVIRGLEQHEMPQNPTAASAADTEPIATEHTPADRKQNRRVEFVLYPAPQVAPVESQ